MTQEFKTGTQLLDKVFEKFGGNDRFFPKEDIEPFLREIISEVKRCRDSFVEIDDETSSTFVPYFSNLGNFHQEIFACDVFEQCITDVGNGLFEVLDSSHPNDQYASFYLPSIFESIRKKKNMLLEEIDFNTKFQHYHEIYNLESLIEKLAKLDTIEEKIIAVNEYIFELQNDPEVFFYLPTSLLLAQNLLSSLYLQPTREAERKLRELSESLDMDDNIKLTNPGKLILLDQLGVLTFLNQKYNPNVIGYFISKVLDLKDGTTQSYVNRILGGDEIEKSKSPYESFTAKNAVKKILTKYSIPFKDKEIE